MSSVLKEVNCKLYPKFPSFTLEYEPQEWARDHTYRLVPVTGGWKKLTLALCLLRNAVMLAPKQAVVRGQTVFSCIG